MAMSPTLPRTMPMMAGVDNVTYDEGTLELAFEMEVGSVAAAVELEAAWKPFEDELPAKADDVADVVEVSSRDAEYCVPGTIWAVFSADVAAVVGIVVMAVLLLPLLLPPMVSGVPPFNKNEVSSAPV